MNYIFFEYYDSTSQKAKRTFIIIESLREGEMISLKGCLRADYGHLNGSVVAIMFWRIDLRVIIWVAKF